MTRRTAVCLTRVVAPAFTDASGQDRISRALDTLHRAYTLGLLLAYRADLGSDQASGLTLITLTPTEGRHLAENALGRPALPDELRQQSAWRLTPVRSIDRDRLLSMQTNGQLIATGRPGGVNGRSGYTLHPPGPVERLAEALTPGRFPAPWRTR